MRRIWRSWHARRYGNVGTNFDETNNNGSNNDDDDDDDDDELRAAITGFPIIALSEELSSRGTTFSNRSRLSNRPDTPIPDYEVESTMLVGERSRTAPQGLTAAQSGFPSRSSRSHCSRSVTATSITISDSKKSEEKKPIRKQGPEVICNICGCHGGETDIPYGKVTEQCASTRTICITCLNRHIEERVGKQMFRNIPCICVQGGCTVDSLSFHDIHRHASSEVFERYDTGLLRANLEADEEFCWCARPGCGSGQLHRSKHKYPIMRCHACKCRTCFSHKCEWHDGRTCEQYDQDARASDEVALLQLLGTSRFRRCPKCSHGVEKNRGCDHMTCRCGHEFCWLCLAPYRGSKGIFKVGNKAHKNSCRHYA